MKKLFMALLALVIMPSAMANFKEGTHYDVIKETATAKPEVIEFFSYYCPHCYKFEPAAEQLKKSLPENVKFKKAHVPFIGGETGKTLQRAFASAEMLEKEKEISQTIFAAYHERKQNIGSEKVLQELFAVNGVDEAKFNSAMNSFMVNGAASQMSKDTENYKIRGVPALVVNGKYLVNTASVKSLGELTDLVTYLTQLR